MKWVRAKNSDNLFNAHTAPNDVGCIYVLPGGISHHLLNLLLILLLLLHLHLILLLLHHLLPKHFVLSVSFAQFCSALECGRIDEITPTYLLI